MTLRCSMSCLLDRGHLKWLFIVVLTLLLVQYITNLVAYNKLYNISQYFSNMYWLGHAASGSRINLRVNGTTVAKGVLSTAHSLTVNGTSPALTENSTTLSIASNSSNSMLDATLKTLLVNLNATVASVIKSSRTATSTTTTTTSTTSTITTATNVTGGNLCPETPPGLKGAIVPDMHAPTWQTLQARYSSLEPGGLWRPKQCKSRHHMFIVIPFRDRDEHLRILLNNLHSLLQKQQLDYGIYVVEQAAGSHFNRGMLMNVGFVEALRVSNYSCVIFHDVDLLPENDKNIYSCPTQPRHMSVAIDKFNYRLPYVSIFGGITALRVDQVKKINGYPNVYFGWGGEDDDFSERVRAQGYQITRYPAEVSRYKMIKHKGDKSNPPNPVRFSFLRTAKTRFKIDGLQNLQYELIKKEMRPLYTWLHVKIDEKKALQAKYLSQFRSNPWIRNILKS